MSRLLPGMLIAPLVILLSLASGCSPSDRPKVVPAKTGVFGGVRTPSPPPQTPIAINTSLIGSTMLCAEYPTQAVFWLIYGGNGRVDRVSANVSAKTGFRFELGTFLKNTDRTGFQYDRSEQPLLLKSAYSDGRSAEFFRDEKTEKPVMICFKKLNTEFIWMDSAMFEAARLMTGSWRCEGPLGNTTLSSNGSISSAVGNGQAFMWSRNKVTNMTTFFAGSPAANGQQQYETFGEVGLQLQELSQGKWSYDVADAGGQVKRNNCVKI